MTARQNPRGRRAGRAHELTTADLVVLSLLEERPMHGYDLLGEYRRQEVADWASISKAQLYYALAKLESAGMLEAGEADDAPRERKVYRPTPRGREALGAALADIGWASARVAQPFVTWLGLSVHASPGAERAVLAARREFLEQEIAKEKESLAYIATLKDARGQRGGEVVRLVIRQLEVELDWVRDLIGQRGA